MRAILLAAGLGTRLKPITNDIPKCLVPIAGKPLLEYWLESLVGIGVDEILINTHYLADKVEQYILSSNYRANIRISYEPVLLGTLNTLRESSSFIKNNDFIIVHADNLCLCNWQSFISSFKQRPEDCLGTMMLFETDSPQSCGIVELDERGVLQAFHEKVQSPPSNLANAAIYIFERKVLSLITELKEGTCDISLDLIPHLIGRLNTWRNDGYLRDIGTVESLIKANSYIEKIDNKRV